MSEVALIYLKGLFEGIKRRVEELKGKLPPTINELKSKEIFQLKSIIEDYNSPCSQLLSYSSEYPEITKLYLPHISDDFLYYIAPSGKTLKITLYEVGEAISTLDKIENTCYALLNVLEFLLKPKIPPSTITQLGLLKKELKELEDEIEPEISNNTNSYC
ncbi:MAG: hypothetical protein QW272_05225 [Candidatus Methanomethylicaceae archaeon]